MKRNIYKKLGITREELAANMRPTEVCRTMQELADVTKSGHKLYCFGAGKTGEKFCKSIQHYDFVLSNIIFVDSSHNKIGKNISIQQMNFPIISKEQMIKNVVVGDSIILTMGFVASFDGFCELTMKYQSKLAEIYNGETLITYGVDEYYTKKYTFENIGYCPICECEVNFVRVGEISRYDYLCPKCFSQPRHRAIVNAINKFLPNITFLDVHESSPGGPSADYLKKTCPRYSSSQYFSKVKSGETVMVDEVEVLCQNIECMTFEDESFDVFITQDVLEHVLNPQKAFAEIGRVLKKGGVHIFTIPWYGEYAKSKQRVAIKETDEVEYLCEPMYHGPSDKGYLVTHDYGMDIVKMIYDNSGMNTLIYLHENRYIGLESEFLEVFVCFKP